MSIDLTPIFTAPQLPLYQNLLIKYTNTPYSIEGNTVINFEQQSVIRYTEEWRSLAGVLLNRDYANIKKINLNSDTNAPYGLHLALKSMKEHEKAVFRAHPVMRQSLDQLEQTHRNIVTIISEKDKEIISEDIIWFITLIAVDKQVNLLNLSPQDRMQLVIDTKTIANQLFQDKQYAQASKAYKDIRKYADSIPAISRQTMTEEQNTFFRTELSKSYTNQAICHLHMNEWHKVQEYTEQAIHTNKNNIKAHILKARSFYERQLLDEAKVQFINILTMELTPEQSEDVQSYISKCKQHSYHKKEQMIYQQIFAKLNDKDPQEELKKQKEKHEQLLKIKQAEQIINSAKQGNLLSSDEFIKLNQSIQ